MLTHHMTQMKNKRRIGSIKFGYKHVFNLQSCKARIFLNFISDCNILSKKYLYFSETEFQLENYRRLGNIILALCWVQTSRFFRLETGLICKF